MKRILYQMMLMGHISHLHRRITGAEFARRGILRSQPWILDYLFEHDGCIQRELADRSHFDPASITSALSGMEEQGLIRRESDEGDRRVQRVFLTPKGRETQQFVQQVFSDAEENAFAGFSAEERAQLGEYLLRIHDNLDRGLTEKEGNDIP